MMIASTVPRIIFGGVAERARETSPFSEECDVHLSAPPRRRPNAETRSREYLTQAEVDRLRASASKLGRHGHRDSTGILLSVRHGLRVAELVGLRKEQIDWDQRVIHIRRVKRGTPGTHPLRRDELLALKKLIGQIERSGHVLESERGGPLAERTWADVIARAGEHAGLGFPVHPHMLRHACGYALANEGHDTRAIQAWMGHRNIQHTVRYTELAPDRFKDFWREKDRDR